MNKWTERELALNERHEQLLVAYITVSYVDCHACTLSFSLPGQQWRKLHHKSGGFSPSPSLFPLSSPLFPSPSLPSLPFPNPPSPALEVGPLKSS